MRCAILSGFLWLGLTSSITAQDWTTVQALPIGTPVRIEQPDAGSGPVEGRIETVQDAALSLLVRGQRITIPREAIQRLTREHRDPLWNGLLIGASLSLVVRVAFAGEACGHASDPRCTIQGALIGAGLGAFVDSRIRRHRLVYDASPPALTLLRMSF